MMTFMLTEANQNVAGVQPVSGEAADQADRGHKDRPQKGGPSEGHEHDHH